MAAWDDGSRAWLDSRGMLHLRSADPDVPEVTLVLGGDDLAGWASDGSVFGHRYYVGDVALADAAHFDGLVRRFTARLR